MTLAMFLSHFSYECLQVLRLCLFLRVLLSFSSLTYCSVSYALEGTFN